LWGEGTGELNQIKFLKNKVGRLMKDEDIKKIWGDYFDWLFNGGNGSDKGR
jgi:hypothetical protein